VEKTGKKRPWKSQERFPLSHSFNNNKLDDRDHFQQNAKTSVASLRGLIGSSRNTDRHHSGMLIDFIGIPIGLLDKLFWVIARRVWSGWKQALLVVTPETVVLSFAKTLQRP
jgi:hypothetical protein